MSDKPFEVTLQYSEGSSHKEYKVVVTGLGDDWMVKCYYGRIGGAMQATTKTSNPVFFGTASRIANELVNEKVAKGYKVTARTGGEPVSLRGAHPAPSKASKRPVLLPQLLNPIDEDEAHRLCNDDAWGLQQKMDGRRMLLKKCGNSVVAMNRKGVVIEMLGSHILKELSSLSDMDEGGPDCVLDGEAVGDVFHAFDLLEDDLDRKREPFEDRHSRLEEFIADAPLGKHITLVPLCTDSLDKTAMMLSLQREKAEGVVFKRLAAPWTPGRPASGGDQLKFKFYATLSAVVWAVNSKRSVELRLWTAAKWQDVGNVTIPPNHEVPKVGEVVEVRYLYGFMGGSLFQPTYLGPRTDIDTDQCVIGQIKFKPEPEAEEEVE